MRRLYAGALALAAGLAAPAVAAAAGAVTGANGASLESAASQASSTGRTVALSLIGLALAVAAVVLVFKRDFKEAIGVLAIGIIAVLLASPVGLSVLQNTVSLLFGSG
ncbi:MAG: hypothetical protein ABSD82_05100 [Solirubrobacteraceae bacterium]|jgi:hypothetical protein